MRGSILMRFRSRAWYFAATLPLFFPTTAAAQLRSTGQITGTVQDQTGAVIPGITVRLEDQATRHEETSVTSSDGTFVFPTLQVGTYQLTVTVTGFQTAVYTGITVDAGRISNVPIDLKLGRNRCPLRTDIEPALDDGYDPARREASVGRPEFPAFRAVDGRRPAGRK
jgi:hypothetical protein